MDITQLVLDRGPEWIPILNESDHNIVMRYWDTKNSPIRFSFAAVMNPALRSAVERWFQYRQDTGSFAAMLAIESFRIEHDRLPNSLDELSLNYLPSIPADLMDPGQGLKYKAVDGSYLIYSVGSDGDDDGGVVIEKSKDPYLPNTERGFGYRFVSTRPLEDLTVQPKLLSPRGPDGDWILIDTRPAQSDPEDS